MTETIANNLINEKHSVVNQIRCEKCPVFPDGFTLLQKTHMRISFYGMLVLGTLAIGLHQWWWGAIYLAYALFALFYGVLWGLCSHCPFAYEYSDCLFYPYTWVTKRFAYRPYAMSLPGKLITFGTFTSIVVIPQYWLYQSLWLAIAFWAMTLSTLGSLRFHYCHHCRNIHCPLNTVEGREKMRAGLDLSYRKEQFADSAKKV